MTKRRPVSGLLLIIAGSLVAGGCDLIDRLHEASHPGGSSGGGNKPGPGTPPSPAPLPPPMTDPGQPGTKPTDPGPAKQLCASTDQCAAGNTCSVEWGACLPHPGCAPDRACPAVCYGTCEAGKPVCRTDVDCRLVSDYCTGCDCRALGQGEPDPVCDGKGVQCLVDPCRGNVAVCAAGRCLVGVKPPAPCAPTVVAGDETTCKSQDEWKLFAYEACRKQDLQLSSYSVGGGDCGAGKTRMVKYDCCPVSAPMTVPPSPPVSTPPIPVMPTPAPPPPSSACAGGSDGSPTSCKPPSVWKQYATEICEKQGMSLRDIGLWDDCGGGNFRYMKYACCK